MKTPKEPKDINTLAFSIVHDLTSGEPPIEANATAVARGKKGGTARAKNLTAEQRREIGKKAAAKRWGKNEE